MGKEISKTDVVKELASLEIAGWTPELYAECCDFVFQFEKPGEYYANFQPMDIVIHFKEVKEQKLDRRCLLAIVYDSRSHPGLVKLWIIGRDDIGVAQAVGNSIQRAGLHARYRANYVQKNFDNVRGCYIWTCHFEKNEFLDLYTTRTDARNEMEKIFAREFQDLFGDARQVEIRPNLRISDNPKFVEPALDNLAAWSNQEYPFHWALQRHVKKIIKYVNESSNLDNVLTEMQLDEFIDGLIKDHKPVSIEEHARINDVLSEKIRVSIFLILLRSNSAKTMTDVWKSSGSSLTKQSFNRHFRQLADADLIEAAVDIDVVGNSKPYRANKSLYYRYLLAQILISMPVASEEAPVPDQSPSPDLP